MSDDEGAFTTGEVLTNNQSTENTTTLDVDKEIFDFGKDLDLPQIQPEENESDLQYLRRIFPSVFSSQWIEVLLHTKQPVVIEARTLLGMAIDNSLINWENGGETLHIVYSLELILRKLVEKGWELMICFFGVLPYDYSEKISSKHQLAAEILKNHLDILHKKGKIQLFDFPNWWGREWNQFLDSYHPSLIVVDLPLKHSLKQEGEDESEIKYEDMQKLLVVDMLSQNIRTLSSEFRFVTTCVWSFDLIIRQPYSPNFLSTLHEKLDSGALTFYSKAVIDDNSKYNTISTIDFPEDSLIINQILILALSTVIEKSNNDNNTINLSKSFLVSNLLARSTPLQYRIQEYKFEVNEIITNFLFSLSSELFAAFQFIKSKKNEYFTSDYNKYILDIIDGNFFLSITYLLLSSPSSFPTSSSIGWSDSDDKLANTIWSSISSLHPFFPISFSFTMNLISGPVSNGETEEVDDWEDIDTEADASPAAGTKSLHQLFKVSGKFVNDMEMDDIEQSAESLRIVNELFTSNDPSAEDAALSEFYGDKIASNYLQKLEKPETETQTQLNAYIERKLKQKYFANLEKVAETLKGAGVISHKTVVARSDAITLLSIQDEIEVEEIKPEANKVQGGRGGKGKKGHINRKELILAKNKEKKTKTEQDSIDKAIEFAKEETTTKDKIFQLSRKLKELREKSITEAAIVKGMMQLIEWCMTQWEEDCYLSDVVNTEEELTEKRIKPQEQRDFTGVVHTVRLCFDTVQLFTSAVEPKDVQIIQSILHILGFPEAALEVFKFYITRRPSLKKEAEYKPRKQLATHEVLKINMSFPVFQLKYCGHLMQRSFDSRPDPRVSGFSPDLWQRELLDIVDSKQSALVVAPTSSGKTFISYYTMKQVIESNKKLKYGTNVRLVVYVAPTKELVRQVAAEVYNHYGPVVGYHLPEYSNSAETCQVLVTIPQCLEELLLNSSWKKQIDYCILDEVHCIQEFGTGDSTDNKNNTVVWEHIIDLLPCPFLALSATIGNPNEFQKWLSITQERFGREVKIVKHQYRWSDLVLHCYLPDTNDANATSFNTILDRPSKPAVQHVHPLACLSLVSIQTTESLYSIQLAPEECLQLFETIQQTIYPPKYLEKLKELVNQQLIEQNNQLAKSINDALNQTNTTSNKKPITATRPVKGGKKKATKGGKKNQDEDEEIEEPPTKGGKKGNSRATTTRAPSRSTSSAAGQKSKDNYLENNVELQQLLKEGKYPELYDEMNSLRPDNYFSGLILRSHVFEYEEILKNHLTKWSKDEKCSEIVENVIKKLGENHMGREVAFPCSTSYITKYFLPLLMELHQSDKLPALVFSLDRHLCNRLIIELIETLERLEENETKKPDYLRKLREYEKNKTKEEKKKKEKRDEAEKKKLAKNAEEAESVDDVETELPGKDERFSFLRKAEGVHIDDKEYWIKRIKVTAPTIKILIRGLDRGVGVHHAALPYSYRIAVEALFRAGHLKVVISTGTLSLGINMPCRSVIFAGDSPLLTPLSFQQMKGRAGRRGYDDFGNIVFFGFPKHRISALISSKLTNLTGTQPITPSIVLKALEYYSSISDSLRKDASLQLRGLLQPSLYSFNLPDEVHSTIQHVHSRWLFRIYLDYLIKLKFIDVVPTSSSAALTSSSSSLRNSTPTVDKPESEATNAANTPLDLDDQTETPSATNDGDSFALDENDQLTTSTNSMANVEYSFKINPLSQLLTELSDNEPSNLLLCYLFLSGTVDELSNQLINQQTRVHELMHLLSYVIKPVPIPHYLNSLLKYKDIQVTSSVILPDLSDDLCAVLQRFNDNILKEFVYCYYSYHNNQPINTDSDNLLPFSDVVFKPSNPIEPDLEDETLVTSLRKTSKRVVLRSPFVALSGLFDEFNSPQELADTCKLHIPIEVDQIPSIIIQDVRGATLPLNAYASDFLKYGKRSLVVFENGIREKTAWELLNGWCDIFKKVSNYLGTSSKVGQLFDYTLKELQSRFERFPYS